MIRKTIAQKVIEAKRESQLDVQPLTNELPQDWDIDYSNALHAVQHQLAKIANNLRAIGKHNIADILESADQAIDHAIEAI